VINSNVQHDQIEIQENQIEMCIVGFKIKLIKTCFIIISYNLFLYSNMPKISYKKQQESILDNALEFIIMNDDERTEDFDDIMNIRAVLASTRFLSPRFPIPKNRGMIDMLWRYGEAEFRQETRMTRQSFKILVRQIDQHQIFHNQSPHVQVDVWQQLYVALKRLGCEGNGISVGAISRLGGVSAGTVVNYTHRVITAIYDILKDLINWPNADERLVISARFYTKYGLRGAVGAVDGTHVVLSQKPHIDGEVFWTRKHCYSINVQIVCDDLKCIRAFVVGWPGSVSDSTAFGDSNIYKHPEEYFSNTCLEYLLADAGFASESWMCTPYRQPSASIPHNKLFNKLFSSGRVVIEHVNGILKGRFGSLRGIAFSAWFYMMHLYDW
jgi:hypothetical protein